MNHFSDPSTLMTSDERMFVAARKAMHLPVRSIVGEFDHGESVSRLSACWLSGGRLVVERDRHVEVYSAVLGYLVEEMGFIEKTFWELAEGSSEDGVRNLGRQMYESYSNWTAREILATPWRSVVELGFRTNEDGFYAELVAARHCAREVMYDGFDPVTMYEPLLRGFASFARGKLWLLP